MQTLNFGSALNQFVLFLRPDFHRFQRVLVQFDSRDSNNAMLIRHNSGIRVAHHALSLNRPSDVRYLYFSSVWPVCLNFQGKNFKNFQSFIRRRKFHVEALIQSPSLKLKFELKLCFAHSYI